MRNVHRMAFRCSNVLSMFISLPSTNNVIYSLPYTRRYKSPRHPASLLSNKCRCSRRIVLERGRDLLLCLVIASETVNTRLDQDQAKFGIFILPIGLQVLTHCNRLFDEVPEVLWDGRCQSYPQTKGTREEVTSVDMRKGRKREIAEYGMRLGCQWDKWRKRTLGLENTQDFITGDETHLRDTVRVAECHTDLGWCKALTGELDDVLDDFVRSGFEPGWWSASVWECRGR
jgi:hypothetical protein